MEAFNPVVALFARDTIVGVKLVIAAVLNALLQAGAVVQVEAVFARDTSGPIFEVIAVFNPPFYAQAMKQPEAFLTIFTFEIGGVSVFRAVLNSLFYANAIGQVKSVFT